MSGSTFMSARRPTSLRSKAASPPRWCATIAGLLNREGIAGIPSVEPQSRDLESYQLYLRGVHQVRLRGEDSLRLAVDLFSAALRRDPSYARAEVGLASAYALLPSYSYEDPARICCAHRKVARERRRAVPHAQLERGNSRLSRIHARTVDRVGNGVSHRNRRRSQQPGRAPDVFAVAGCGRPLRCRADPGAPRTGYRSARAGGRGSARHTLSMAGPRRRGSEQRRGRARVAYR